MASDMINEYFISSIQDIIPNSNISDPNFINLRMIIDTKVDSDISFSVRK